MEGIFNIHLANLHPLLIVFLIIAGFMVGFVNTVAGSGTVITYSLFMFLGIPAQTANGTIRFGVIMQTMVSSFQFYKRGHLPLKQGLKIALPIVLGSITGARIAIGIHDKSFEIVLGFIMLIIFFLLLFKPGKWLKGKEKKTHPLKWKHWLLYFITGLYGGFIHIGVGIFLIVLLVLASGYDLLKANAIKVFVVLLYSPFALAVFMIHGQVDYRIGAISAIGNILGGYIGSKMAIAKGTQFIRWFLATVILLFAGKLFGLLDFLYI